MEQPSNFSYFSAKYRRIFLMIELALNQCRRKNSQDTIQNFGDIEIFNNYISAFQISAFTTKTTHSILSKTHCMLSRKQEVSLADRTYILQYIQEERLRLYFSRKRSFFENLYWIARIEIYFSTYRLHKQKIFYIECPTL